MMSSDPRVQKPRQPKAYTEQQLVYLKGHLPEFERRSHGSIRGDAKKFALERASEYINRFGLPHEFIGVEEADSRFKEQIYNWFKNTIGRTRRKLEGRPRSSKKALAEKANPHNLTWNSNVVTPNIVPYSHVEASNSSSPATTSQTIISPIQYGNIPPNTSIPQNHSVNNTPSTSSHTHTLQVGLNINQNTLCEAFLTLDSPMIASMVQSYVTANPSPTPLTPVVEALFESTLSEPSSSFSRGPHPPDPHPLLQRFLDASAYFPASITHAGVSGPLAGPRALQMQIRKSSMWTPTPPRSAMQQNVSSQTSATSSSPISLSDEMQRIAGERQRRKDHIQWARIHAAALELGVWGMGRMDTDNSAYVYAMSRAFSEMVARDAVWESDEAEWVAGIYVLRAVIRTAMRGDRRQRDDYNELLRKYEGRWKEIKDEARQALVTEVLLSAKEEVARLDDALA